MGTDFENESVRLGFDSSRRICNNLLKGDITNVLNDNHQCGNTI